MRAPAVLCLTGAAAAAWRPAAPQVAERWELEDWQVKEHGESTHADGYAVNTTTYLSPVISLMTGGAHFSLNTMTKIPFPAGDYVITSALYSMVNADGPNAGKETSLTEVYNHHWLIGTATSEDVLAPCEDDMFFGGGAEFRGMGMPPANTPKYGVKKIGSKGVCGGNLHFIRTEDLAQNWTGFNDPSQFADPEGAARKNCIECGFAPGRAAVVCNKGGDGGFQCCFDGSRCPVNHPEDKTKRGYQLTYTVEWTRDLTVRKAYTGGCLDISDGVVEWNVAPNLNNKQVGQVCDDKICTITHSWTVPKKQDASGLCPGYMFNSYLHQHTGAINGTMNINGKDICTSKPRIGTDPNPATNVRNEKGYLVGFEFCIDEETKSNTQRLEAGDVVTVTGLYDVDVASTRNAPFPGGKHGGVMGLYFFSSVCDEGTFNEQYVCRQNQCILVPAHGEYTGDGSKAACEKACK